MTWDSKGWPVMGNQGRVESVFETDCLPMQKQLPATQTDAYDRVDTFDTLPLGHEWNFIYVALMRIEGEQCIILRRQIGSL